jgi:hypothetical protein
VQPRGTQSPESQEFTWDSSGHFWQRPTNSMVKEEEIVQAWVLPGTEMAQKVKI